jgi:hypothetical protein
MRQTVQIAGTLLILVPFILAQLGRVQPSHKVYTLLNLLGSTILAVQAGQAAEWGFLLLEGVWALVSLIAIIRTLFVRKDRSMGTADQPAHAGDMS